MQRDESRGSKAAIWWIAALVGACVLAIAVGAWAVDAALDRPVLTPSKSPAAALSPVATSTAGVSAPAQPAEPVPTQAVPKAAAPSSTPPKQATPKKTTPQPVPADGPVVVIDAGHQAQGSSALEPIGPGSSTRKPEVAGGATGVVTKRPESLVNLEVSRKLRDELERRGVRVVMVRESQDVDIPNSERAGIANRENAALFIRLHCDGGPGSVQGITTLVPAANQWTGPIVAPSGVAGRKVHAAVIAATGAKDRGVTPRSDMSGFNWSKVPSVIVEMGFLTNAQEDRLLATDAYQDKLATGLANGIQAYLGR